MESIRASEIFRGASLNAKGYLDKIFILDTIGRLTQLYKIADAVFIGGSLVKKGGQNILEPASWGKVVLYGSSMEDFLEGKKLLEGAGAGHVVRNSNDIVDISENFLKNTEEREDKGKAGREAILEKAGAASRNAEMAKYLIEKK